MSSPLKKKTRGSCSFPLPSPAPPHRLEALPVGARERFPHAARVLALGQPPSPPSRRSRVVSVNWPSAPAGHPALVRRAWNRVRLLLLLVLPAAARGGNALPSRARGHKISTSSRSLAGVRARRELVVVVRVGYCRIYDGHSLGRRATAQLRQRADAAFRDAARGGDAARDRPDQVDERQLRQPVGALREEYLQSARGSTMVARQVLARAAGGAGLDVASILSAVGKSPPPPVQPWVVFTAGCMGAVRRHAVPRSAAAAAAARASRPPARAHRRRAPPAAGQDARDEAARPSRRAAAARLCVHRPRPHPRALPEHPQYVAADPERAGLLTQAEAGTIGEVARECSPRPPRVDRLTLRDGGWWSREIARIRDVPAVQAGDPARRASWPRAPPQPAALRGDGPRHPRAHPPVGL